jgi:hypothetical protein
MCKSPLGVSTSPSAGHSGLSPSRRFTQWSISTLSRVILEGMKLTPRMKVVVLGLAVLVAVAVVSWTTSGVLAYAVGAVAVFVVLVLGAPFALTTPSGHGATRRENRSAVPAGFR